MFSRSVWFIILYGLCFSFAQVVQYQKILGNTVKEETTCLRVCRCQDDVRMVDCSNLGLSKIPSNIPNNTVVLKLSGNSIKAIDEVDLLGLNDVEELYLDNNEITEIHPLSFMELSALRSLHLRSNKLSSWSYNITEPVKNSLVLLDLSGNLLKNIQKTMFSSKMTNLRTLTLDTNGLLSIEDGSFQYLHNLEVLSLKTNVIKALDDNGYSFTGLTNLKELHLDYNFFGYFPEEKSFEPLQGSLNLLSFSGHQRINSLPPLRFSNLSTFNISSCGLTIINNLTFAGAPSLKTIDVSRNSIRFIASQALSGLNQLETIHLSHNALLFFPSRALSPVNCSLEFLYADDQNFSSLPDERFLQLANLKLLSLRRNLLQDVDENSFFRNLKQLKILRLSATQLRQFPTKAIAHLSNLEVLEFNENLIANLTISSLPVLPSLRHIELDGSSLLTHIGNHTFEQLGSNVSFISISGGALSSLEADAFSNLNSLKELRLTNNQLQQATSRWMKGKQLNELLLSGNAWLCDCEMNEFQDWLQSSDYLQIPSKDSVTCHYPRSLRGRPLVQLNESLLTCEPSECPMMCLCGRESSGYKRESTDITRVDCSDEKLESIPDLIPASTQLLRMDMNCLTSIGNGTFRTLPNLQRVSLAENQISDLQNTSFAMLKDLMELDISSNSIKRISQTTFANLTRLEKLRLDQNSIGSLESMGFIEQHNLTYLDLSYNMIEELKNESFIGLQNLQTLILSHNFLQYIDSGTFQPLEKLQSLYLTENRISHLNHGLFLDLNDLQTLDLSENSFNILPPYFMSSTSLTYLKMEKARVEVVSNFAFSHLPNLNTLRLKDNQIRVISDAAFHIGNDSEHHNGNESKLLSLDLTSNQLTKFPSEALKPVARLQSLFLSSNPIKNISHDDNMEQPFLPDLRNLYLSNTEIANITESSILRFLSSLLTLVINDAKLESIPTPMFAFLPQLQFASFDNNPITSITNKSFLFHPHMSTISLRFSETLSVIGDEAFTNFPNLTALQLSNGGLRDIGQTAFRGLHQLRILDLSTNSLATPHSGWFEAFSPDSLTSVSLFNNPWVCDCAALPYKEWLLNGASGLKPYTLSFICDEPMLNKGQPIEDADMTCLQTTTPQSTSGADRLNIIRTVAVILAITSVSLLNICS